MWLAVLVQKGMMVPVVVNTPTVGRIANGAIVEQSITSGLMQDDYLTLNLHISDFTTAKI